MAEFSNDKAGINPLEERARLTALHSLGILDTPAEPGYDAITRLAVDYFQVDSAVIAFADNTRVWVKSNWGEMPRELPRANSMFDFVLAEDGPVVICDILQHPDFQGRMLHLHRLEVRFVASVPVRAFDGNVVGMLSIFGKQIRPALTPNELRTLVNLAVMVSNQLELHKLQESPVRRRAGRPPVARTTAPSWPRAADLQRAIDRHELVLFYQPEVDLVSLRIVGLEALIRWRHPERGLLLPQDFIPLAEECGLILPIGDWGLAEACKQIQAWKRDDLGNQTLRVSVNLSARQFSRAGLADHVESLLLQSGTSSVQLGLELTESSLIPNMCTAHKVLDGLRLLGVSLSMDDFGTGYSSLSYLHSFPFDVLKIDRSFVSRMSEGEQARQIVRTILELARALQMGVVAEGIETYEQYWMLRKMGCRYGQGFLFAKPMAAEDVSHLLRLPGRVLTDHGLTQPMPQLAV